MITFSKFYSIIFLLLIAFISVISCGKDETGDLNYSEIEISSITGIGNFTYKNGLITSVGLEKFLYDETSRLTGTRMNHIDTINSYDILTGGPNKLIVEKLEKYSYLWENNLIKGRLIDSVMNKTIKDGGIFSLSVLSNLPSAEYFSSGDRLDSIIILKSVPESNATKYIFEYNGNGNIIKSTEYFSNNPLQTLPPIPSYSKTVTEYFEYDNKPNPYYILLKKCGVILNKLEGNNISKNNPLRSKTIIQYQNSLLELNITYDYEYNSNGLPTKISINKGTVSERNTYIGYN
jgi:hypothetical protein